MNACLCVFVHVWVPAYVCLCTVCARTVCIWLWRMEEAMDVLVLELLLVESCSMWMLGPTQVLWKSTSTLNY